MSGEGLRGATGGRLRTTQHSEADPQSCRAACAPCLAGDRAAPLSSPGRTDGCPAGTGLSCSCTPAVKASVNQEKLSYFSSFGSSSSYPDCHCETLSGLRLRILLKDLSTQLKQVELSVLCLLTLTLHVLETETKMRNFSQESPCLGTCA